MKKETRDVFIANDGKEFNNEAECLFYESSTSILFDLRKLLLDDMPPNLEEWIRKQQTASDLFDFIAQRIVESHKSFYTVLCRLEDLENKNLSVWNK